MYLNVNLKPPSPSSTEATNIPKTPEILNSLMSLSSPPLPQSYAHYQTPQTENNNNNSPSGSSTTTTPTTESFPSVSNASPSSSSRDAKSSGPFRHHHRSGSWSSTSTDHRSPSSSPQSDLQSPVSTVDATMSALIKAGLKHQIKSKMEAAGKVTPESFDKQITIKEETKDIELTPEDEERRNRRRERNKIAATKCRNKKKERTFILVSESEFVEEENCRLKNEVRRLTSEKMSLQKILSEHNKDPKSPCLNTGAKTSPYIKPHPKPPPDLSMLAIQSSEIILEEKKPSSTECLPVITSCVSTLPPPSLDFSTIGCGMGVSSLASPVTPSSALNPLTEFLSPNSIEIKVDPCELLTSQNVLTELSPLPGATGTCSSSQIFPSQSNVALGEGSQCGSMVTANNLLLCSTYNSNSPNSSFVSLPSSSLSPLSEDSYPIASSDQLCQPVINAPPSSTYTDLSHSNVSNIRQHYICDTQTSCPTPTYTQLKPKGSYNILHTSYTAPSAVHQLSPLTNNSQTQTFNDLMIDELPQINPGFQESVTCSDPFSTECTTSTKPYISDQHCYSDYSSQIKTATKQYRNKTVRFSPYCISNRQYGLVNHPQTVDTDSSGVLMVHPSSASTPCGLESPSILPHTDMYAPTTFENM